MYVRMSLSVDNSVCTNDLGGLFCRHKEEEMTLSSASVELIQVKQVRPHQRTLCLSCVWCGVYTCVCGLWCVMVWLKTTSTHRVQEYDAYKTHMTAQLEQERQLNKKLQKLLNY